MTNLAGHAAYVWQPGKFTSEGAKSTSMDLDTIHVPGLISHYSREAAPTDHSLSNLTANSANAVLLDDATQPSSIWSPADSTVIKHTVIKHIPKSARHSCASHLAALLRKVVSNPDSTPKWFDLFNWGHTFLHAPKRGGKRHNLASAIKHRIASYSVIQLTPLIMLDDS